MGEMKGTGVEWIGEVPEGWTVERMKYLAIIGPPCTVSHVGASDHVGYAPMECIKPGYFIPREAEYASLPLSLTPFCNDDIVLAKVTPCFENGNIALMTNLPSNIGFGSSELFVVRATNINRRFLFYWLRNESFVQGGIASMTGAAGLKRVSLEYLSNVPVTVPPLSEQRAIADFLDAKCAAIDDVRSDTEREIALLKEYKTSLITRTVTKGLDPNVEKIDSGIEWLGNIPAHWELSRIGRHYEVALGKMLQSEPLGAGDTVEHYLCAANVKWDGIDMDVDKTMWFRPEEKERLRLRTDDLLITEGGSTAGESALYQEDSEPRYFQNSVNCIRGNNAADTHFLFYWMYMLYHIGWVRSVCSTISMPHFTKEKVLSTPLVLPPSDERKSIAACLDTRCAAIDDQIADLEAELTSLEEYKKSLIYDYVTGKKEVPANAC